MMIKTHSHVLATRKVVWHTIIKMSSSESRPRKVELTFTDKNVMIVMSILHKTAKLVNTPTKRPYYIDIFTTKSITLALEVEQLGASSDLIVPIPIIQKVSYFSSMHPR